MPALLPEVALLQLVRYRTSKAVRGWWRLARGTSGVGSAPGLRFARVLGSGRDGGFGLAPSWTRQGLIAFFDDETQARRFAAASSELQSRRADAEESMTLLLRATSCRGSWGGVALASSAHVLPGQPMASLTRAAIRPRFARRFWRHAPATQHGIERAAGCRLAVGLGEAPLLRQATFSLWDSAEAMDAYARQGPHLAAIHAAVREGWFSESMFVRFEALHIEGRWQGLCHG